MKQYFILIPFCGIKGRQRCCMGVACSLAICPVWDDALINLPLVNISFFFDKISSVMIELPLKEECFQLDKVLSNDVNNLRNFSRIAFDCAFSTFFVFLDIEAFSWLMLDFSAISIYNIEICNLLLCNCVYLRHINFVARLVCSFVVYIQPYKRCDRRH